MSRLRGLLPAGVCLLLLCGGAAAGENPQPTRPGTPTGAASGTESADPMPARGRLRFRRTGPPCLCGGGLSEEEIRQRTGSRAGGGADNNSVTRGDPILRERRE